MVSLFTIICALIFAIALWLNQHFFLKALKIGPMGFSTFILGISLVIPVIYGSIFLGSQIALSKIIALLFLIISLWLSLDVKKENASGKWLLFSVCAMLFVGVIGIMQTIHQNSVHKDELISFLRLSFLFCAIINLLGCLFYQRKTPSNFKTQNKATPLAIFSGIFMAFIHVINLYLAGVLPQIIFFPVVNGGLIFASLLSGIIFFKEKLTRKQFIGILIGIAALCVISL
ncbi:MAG: hypothetical protein E7568_02540 [Ruminococcaceae bacterium]|nr:hypothetical protein [Oscillospiraceae bacterium]